MAFTLSYRVSRVPPIPAQAHPARADGRSAVADRQEHFGTEEAALRRVGELLPAAEWIGLRLFGPDGRLLAGQEQLQARLAHAAGAGKPPPP